MATRRDFVKGLGLALGPLAAGSEAAPHLPENSPADPGPKTGSDVGSLFPFIRREAVQGEFPLSYLRDDFRDLARLRLAAILLDEKAYDEALKLLEAKHAAAYDSQYAALRGDVLVAKNQPAEARTAYQTALEKAGREQSAFRESVRMRLDALGG